MYSCAVLANRTERERDFVVVVVVVDAVVVELIMIILLLLLVSLDCLIRLLWWVTVPLLATSILFISRSRKNAVEVLCSSVIVDEVVYRRSVNFPKTCRVPRPQAAIEVPQE